MIKQIKFCSVPVTDQDRALAFWTEKMGFHIRTDQPFDDKQRWIELGIPGAETRLVLFTPDDHKDLIGKMSNITFMTDDVVATYRDLSAKGVHFEGPPQVAEWGSAAIFQDPDGNTFCLSSR